MTSETQADALEARRERAFGPRTEEHRRVAEDHGIVAFGETWWRDHYDVLKQFGYTLRPRYHPQWTPPWRGTGRSHLEFEEGQKPRRTVVMDATRISDGTYVTLKRLDMSNGRSDMDEVQINQYLSSEPLASDPRNHCARAIEIFQLPDEQHIRILVMPLLRPFDDPPFATIGEAVAFFTQLFEGLKFLHDHRIAHRDCCFGNIMMDAAPMYPEPWHPANIEQRRDWEGKAMYLSRTERPVKYYFIDYGLSEHYKAEAYGRWPPLELPVHGGDKSAPENQEDKGDAPSNPFATDIYYIGNLVRQSFMERYSGFGFMKKLVADMVQDDPSKRPEINEVVARFAKIRASLYSWKLRARMARKTELTVVALFRYPPHVVRTIRLMIARTPAIPDP